ncbi:MAG: family 10 glycosylhydrolase [Verrucomicrobiae bacterium]
MPSARPHPLPAVCFLLAACIASAAAGSSSDPALVDDCEYRDSAAAQAVWKPMSGSSPVSMEPADGRMSLRMECNFKGTTIERASWDRDVTIDLASCMGLQFEVLCHNASPVSQFCVYLKSGGGWYRATFFPESSTGWNRVTIDKAATTSEGAPSGWGKISAIRISAWRGSDSSTEFFLRDMRKTGVLGGDASVAIIRGESVARSSPGEARSVEQFAKEATENFQSLGIGTTMISDLDVPADGLKQAALVVLPYNPQLPGPIAKTLTNYVHHGGKVLAFYLVPDQLRRLLGVEGGEWVKASHPGAFSKIRIADKALPGAPVIVAQQSWNISALRPIPGVGRELADWLDEKEQPTGYAAMIGSPNGIVLTHVLLPDDLENKRRMLMAMAGSMAPGIWQQAAEGSITQIGKISDYKNFDDAMTGIARMSDGDARVGQALASARALRETAVKRMSQRNFSDAMELSSAGSRKTMEAFCMAQRPSPGEFRAFWCHNPFGVEEMDWDEAISRLADNGFTAILPNMLWGGAAYYGSKVLPVAMAASERGDQIAKCLAACGKHGIQMHVWKVNWNLGHAAPPEFVEKMRREGRLQSDAHGGEELWLCPSSPENQKLEIDSLVEVVRNYDVDGIHFDYIRYPDAGHCFCAGCRKRFEQASGLEIVAWPGDVLSPGPIHQRWLDWRRDNITAAVKAVSEQARGIKPMIRLSAAVFSNWPSDRDSVGQDWKMWCEKGYLDFVCPMDYTPFNVNFESMVSKQVGWAGKTPCYPGIGVSASSSPFGADRAIEQIGITRRYRTGGFVIFNYGAAESRDLLPMLGLGITRKPSP